MTDPREPYALVALEALYSWAAEQPFGSAPWLHDWEDLPPPHQEALMRAASAVAARAVHDAGLEAERMRMQLFAIGTALPAARRALVIAVGEAKYEAEAKPFRRALEIFGGEEEGL